MNRADVLSGKAGLVGVQWALQGKSARSMLRDELGCMLRPDQQAGRFHLTRAKYKPGRKINAYYDVPLYGPSGEQGRMAQLSVAWLETLDGAAPLDSLLKMQEEADQHGLLQPFLYLWRDIPDWGIRLQVWPLDPEFPQLVRMGDPAHTPRLLQSAGITTPDSESTITPLRYRPGERHVLRIQRRLDGSSPSEDGRLYVKLYRDAGAAARAFRVANRVVDWLAENRQDFRGIRPAGWSEEDAVLLYPHAPGIPLSRLLHRSPRWLAQHFRLTGEALHLLHDGPPSLKDDLGENTLEKEAKVIKRASEHIQAFLPDTARMIYDILDRAQELYNRLEQEPATFTHSDFKADHLLVSSQGLMLIDYDTCTVADPALDAGKFLADLNWWFMQTGTSGAEQAQEAFLQGYIRTGENDRLLRARVFQTLILIKIAARRARLASRHWADTVNQAVTQANAILEAVKVLHERPAVASG